MFEQRSVCLSYPLLFLQQIDKLPSDEKFSDEYFVSINLTTGIIRSKQNTDLTDTLIFLFKRASLKEELRIEIPDS